MPQDHAQIAELHEVTAHFTSPERMQEAIRELEMAGFDRADLSLPEENPPPQRATPESSAKPADTDEDARQARTMHTSTAASAAALAAAGVTVATGGAAAPAVAAALVAGGLIGGATYAVSSVSNASEQDEREAKARADALLLSVRAPTREQQSKAAAILRDHGGDRIETS